ncbi:protein lethal(2)essential for life-like [Schistocerca serialis cubense]|uniref:protein lethal(2)essential for life-like n=1 Tax=Schistocerca serialis cubense TaxID=2023355 RepID=UPI00214E15E7|nr:protein lethal(2)essential for life-like [Schistocerca serialis cubense]
MSRRRVCYWPGQADRARDWLFLNLDLSDEDLNVARYSPTTVCYDPRRVASATPDACCCSYYHQGPDACCCNYSRPWRYTAPVKSGFSKIERSKDGFKVTLDVKHFKEGDVKVKVVGNDVVVEAEHDERQDEHGYISRSLKRKYALPDNVDSDKVRTELSSDGILTITAPKKENRKTQVPWVKEVHWDLEKCRITAEEIVNRQIFRKKVADVKKFFEEKTRKNRVFSEKNVHK